MIIDKMGFREAATTARADAEMAVVREAEARAALEARQTKLSELEANLLDLQRNMADLSSELGTELHAQLNAAERAELERLNP